MDKDTKLDFSNQFLPVVINHKKGGWNEQKKEEFDLYVIWKSMPTFYKRPPKDKKTKIAPTSAEFLEMMGVEDDLIYELAEIKNQKQFAEKYDVSEPTLVSWNKRKEVATQIDDIRKWGMTLTKNVVFAHYNKILQTADPLLIVAWYKFIEGLEEKPKTANDNLGPVVQINYSIRDPKAPQIDPNENGALIIKETNGNTKDSR